MDSYLRNMLEGINVYQASSYITSSAASGPDAIKLTLENPVAGKVYALVLSASVSRAAGSNNLCSFHLRRVTTVANGITTLVKGIPLRNGDKAPSSVCNVRRDNTSDNGVVTAITGTLSDFGMGCISHVAVTAAGITTPETTELVQRIFPGIGPGQNLCMTGSQTATYVVYSWEWVEIPSHLYRKHEWLEWQHLLRSLVR